MKEIRADVEIEAPVERVWKVLTDFNSYPEWNPFITAVQGKPEAGERLVVTIQPPGRKGRDFRPSVLAAREGQELRWLGRLVAPDTQRGFQAMGEALRQRAEARAS
jgi:hypothetical protein